MSRPETVNVPKPMKLRACPWCGWRSTTLWVFFDGVIGPHKKKPTEYSIHCNHCGFASKKSRFRWRTRWFWNHGNHQLRLRKGRKYHIYGQEF